MAALAEYAGQSIYLGKPSQARPGRHVLCTYLLNRRCIYHLMRPDARQTSLCIYGDINYQVLLAAWQTFVLIILLPNILLSSFTFFAQGEREKRKKVKKIKKNLPLALGFRNRTLDLHGMGWRRCDATRLHTAQDLSALPSG